MKELRIYTMPGCLACIQAKKFLEGKGKKFIEIDVSKSSELKKELKEKSGKESVPVFELDGLILVGFNHKAIEQLIKISE